MFKKLFDLSQPLYHNCPGWPTYDLTEVHYEAVYPNDGFNAEKIMMNTHTGTHLDAPFHFYPESLSIDEMPVDLFQGKAMIVNIASEIKPKQGITRNMVEKYDNIINEGMIVILYTGWGQKRAFTKEYCHDWPYLSEEAASWLRDKKVKGVGIDAMSLGGWYEGTGRPCHEVLLAANIWLLEELCIPDELLAYESFYLTAFPLKILKGSGAPCRAVAMV